MIVAWASGEDTDGQGGALAPELIWQAMLWRALREEIGWPSATPSQDECRGATVAVPSCDAAGLVAELGKRDIVTSFRDDNVRASFHFYNNDDDVEAFVAAMTDLRGSYRPRSESRN